MGGRGSGPRGPPVAGEVRGVRVYQTEHIGDPHLDPARRVAQIFQGARDTASASQDKKAPPKLHAVKRTRKDIQADEARARDEERKRIRLSRDARNAAAEAAAEAVEAEAVKDLLELGEACHPNPPPHSTATTATTATNLYPTLANKPSESLSGCAPPDLELYMLELAKTLPTRKRGTSTYELLDRKQWPTFAVPSPHDSFFKNKKLLFGPPSTTYFIDPSLFGTRMKCHLCDDDKNVVAKAWRMKPLHGIGRRDYVLSRLHRCEGCPLGQGIQSPSIPFNNFIEQLPQHQQDSLPFTTQFPFKDYLVSRELVTFINSSIVKSSASQLEQTLKDLSVIAWTQYHLSHARLHVTSLHPTTKEPPPPSTMEPPPPTTGYPLPVPTPTPPQEHAPAEDKIAHLQSITGRESWSSLHLSANTILDIYKVSAMGRKEIISNHLFAQGGEVLYMDHTFKDVKHINIDGLRPAAILTIMNERGQIVKQLLVRNKGITSIKESLKVSFKPLVLIFFFFFFPHSNTSPTTPLLSHHPTPPKQKHYASYLELGLTPPKMIYADNVEEVEATLLECYPSIRPEQGGFGVKQCPTHAIRRIYRSLTKNHGLVGNFLSDLAYAMYSLDENDVKKVKKHLRSKGHDPEDKQKFSKKYFHNHKCVRRYLKQAGQLTIAIDAVWDAWTRTITYDREVNADLFTEGDQGTAKEYAMFRALCSAGYLSDPDPKVFPMHRKVGKPRAGELQKYRSLRGTSQLEGYHCHLHKVSFFFVFLFFASNIFCLV